MEDEEVKRTTISISILGESAVGKTCICSSFLGLEFNPNHLSTIGADRIDSTIKIETGEELKLKIWDTAGQERFRSIPIGTLRSSQGVIVVFDLTDKESFYKVTNWLKDIRNISPNKPIVLFGNKSDLVDERKVDKDEIDNLCKKEDLKYFETSAKNNTGIKEGFTKIATLAFKQYETQKNRGQKLSNKVKKKKEKKC